MAIKKEIELEVKSDSVKSFKTQLREAQAEVVALTEKFGVASKEVAEAAKKAAELKDKIGDAKALTDAFNPDAKFKALTSSLGGVASGFGAVQGAMGLIGVQGEEVEKTLLKVQSAMAISESIQQLGEARDSFTQLGAVAKNVFSGIKGAIAATGIGILLVAIGTLYTYWDDIKGAVSGVSAEQEKLNVKAQHNLDIENRKLDKLNGQDNTLRLQGLSEKQILQLKIKQTDEIIKASEIQIQQSLNTAKAQEEAAIKNKKILQGIIEFTTIPLQFILGTVDKVAKVLGKDLNLRGKLNDWAASLVFDPKEVKMEGYKVYKEQHDALEKIKNDRAGLQLQINNIDKQAHDERVRLQKEASTKAKELAEEKNKQDLERAQWEIDADNAAYAYFEEQEAKKKAKQDEINAQKLADEQMLADLEIQILNKKLEDEKKLEEEKKQLRANQIQGVQNTLQMISDLTELFAGKSRKAQERAFKIQKAANIASALIDTYKSAVAVFAETKGGIVFRSIAAGAAITAGLLNVKKIASQKFDGGASSGGGGSTPSISGGGSSGSGGVIAPNFNIVGNTGGNQLGALGSQPIQAYVVSTDVSSQQALDRNRLRNATF
jgi:hypothetical protein